MRTRILIGAALIVAAGLGAFAANVFGGGGSEPTPLTVQRVATHKVDGPPAGAPKIEGKAALFTIQYKTSNTVNIPNGYSSYNLGTCSSDGAVLSSYHLRNGDNLAGLLAAGNRPNGTRRVTYVIDNTTGSTVKGKLGLVCIK